MSISTGELRETLIDCIEKVKKGQMSANDAKAVAMLAGQVTLSLQVEVNARRDQVGGTGNVGTLALGGGTVERTVVVDQPKSDVIDIEDAEPARAPWPGLSPSAPPSVWRGAATVHRLKDGE